MGKLHVFDMDGTLLRGAAVEEISRHLGCFEPASAIEQAYLRGELVDEPKFWDDVLALWAGASEQDLDDAFEASAWMDRVPEVFADIAERGEHSVVISQSPLFIVRRLERWGVGRSFATMVEQGVPCQVDQLLSQQAKVEITMQLLAELDLSPRDCVAYGDSTSDIELFRALGHTVAVNAAPIIRDLAAHTYDGPDMWHAYLAGRALLERVDA
jgi:phosphoserine phosphatase